jgi:IclR family transcriptional regulator, acetate operon repressor
MKTGPKPVGVLRKTFSILSCFRSHPDGLTLGDIARLTGINKSTAYRLLVELENEGFLQREHGTYRLGQGIFQLGILAPQPLALLKAAYPVMADLARHISETTNLAILDHTEILVLHAVESPHEFRMVAKVGSRRPFYVTAIGKAIAAFLTSDKQEALLQNLDIPLEQATPNSIENLLRLKEELTVVRQRGYAIDNEEAVPGVRAVGAPVFSASGEVTAALSVSGPISRILTEHIPEIASAVIKAADAITTYLGGAPDVFRRALQEQVATRA